MSKQEAHNHPSIRRNCSAIQFTMTSQAFSFTRSDALEAILTQSDHFLIVNSYKELVDVSNSMRLPLPIISLEADGSSSLSVSHAPYIPADFSRGIDKDASFRLCVSTIVPNGKDFDPIAQTDVDYIKSFPSVHSIKVKLPSFIELAHADSDAEVLEILSKEVSPSSHEKSVLTSVAITPGILNRIIEDRCINPTQTLTSVLAWMRENNVTRGPKGGKYGVSNIKVYAKEIISFLTLAFKLFESPDDDDNEEPFVSKAILAKLAPVLVDNPNETETFSMSEFKGSALHNLNVCLDSLNTGKSSSKSVANHASDSEDSDDEVLQRKGTKTSIRIGDEVTEIPSDSSNPILKQQHISPNASSPADNLSRGLPAAGLSGISSKSKKMPGLNPPLKKNSQNNHPGASSQQKNPSSSPALNSGSIPAISCQKDAAMISVLTQMSNELKLLKSAPSSSVSGGSSMTFSKWNSRVQEAILVLSSPDPTIPATAPSPELLDFCLEPSGVSMAQKFTSTYIDLDSNPDIALFRNIKRGNFSMNEGFWPGVKITGLSPLSCPPKFAKGSGKDHNYAMARAEFLCATNSLSEQDIKDLSFQSFFIPTKTLQFFTVMTNYCHILKVVFTDKSFIFETVSDMFETIKQMSSQIESYEEKDGIKFFFTLVGAFHTAVAIYINKTLKRPSKANRSLERNFERILDSLRDNTFMNTFALPLIKSDNADSSAGSADGGNSSPSGGNPSSSNGNSGGNNSSTDQNGNNTNNGPTNGNKRRKVHNAHLNETCSNVFDMSALSKALPAAKTDGVKIPKYKECECCLKWFFKGVCDSNCPRKATHVQLRGNNLEKWKKFRNSLENKCRDLSISRG